MAAQNAPGRQACRRHSRPQVLTVLHDPKPQMQPAWTHAVKDAFRTSVQQQSFDAPVLWGGGIKGSLCVRLD